jgi:NADP-dependent 3-hydroxy acid dehydrogenase YdfG
MCTTSDDNNTSVDGNENGDTNNDTQQQQQQNTTSSTKVILITGASSGIGKATAIYLAEKGIATALTLFARRQEPLDKTAQELKTRFPKIQTLVVPGDASIAVDNQRAVDLSVATFGGLHGMFINAGVFKGHKSLVETSDKDIDTLLNT